jgi:tetratricopeptide (TPR) repeat protein
LLAHAYALTLTTHPARFADPVSGFSSVVGAFLEKADAAARRAIQADPTLAEGYFSLGIAQIRRAKLGEAEELYSTALALDPNNPDALHEFSQLLASTGRLAEALTIRKKLQALEPFVPVFNWATGVALWVDGQDKAALSIFEALPANSPRSIFLATAYAAAGQYSDAADALFKLPSEFAPAATVETAASLLRAAPVAAASPQTLPRLGILGFAYLYAGAPGRALEFNEGDLDAGFFVPAFAVALWHPSYAAVRKTERFKAYVRRAGMVEYWQQKGWPNECRSLGVGDFVCD